MRHLVLLTLVVGVVITATMRGRDLDPSGSWRLGKLRGPCSTGPRRLGCMFHDSASLGSATVSGLVTSLLRVSATTIAQLDRVTVTATLKNATANDWVGAYCVDDETKPPSDHEYMDYQMIDSARSTRWTFGPLVNMRCAWQFRYFTQQNDDAFVKVAMSPLVRFDKGPLEPLHVHVATTETPRDMRIMWVSANATTAPIVEYGTSRTQLTSKVTVISSETYNASDMCEAPATTVAPTLFRDPGVMYSTVLPQLDADATYFYRICSSDYAACSAIFTLKTPPLAGEQNGTASFFVYGDLGDWTVHATGPYNPTRSGTTIDLMRRDMSDSSAHYVAVLHVGDLSYGKGSTFLWDQFGALIEPVASEIPYLVGVGNHEYAYVSGGDGKDPSGAGATNGFHPPQGNYGADSQGECGVPLNKRFLMPNNGNRVFWWSTEIGLMHHTMISSEHDFTTGSAMYKWLENDLKSVNRTTTPWLFLHLHRPMYTSEMYESDHKVSLFLRQHLEPLLAKYNVDAVFSGHYHAYELTCPVFNGTCRSELINNGFTKALAPVHILVGSAGADLDNVGYYDVPWRVDAQLEYGYGRVHVVNGTHAQWEFVRNRDEAVASSTWIISDHNWEV